jgi:hypothetical protein
MQLAMSDVVVGPSVGEVRVWDEKTQKGSGVSRVIPLSWEACPQVGQLLQYWQRLQARVWAAAGPAQPAGFLQLPGDPFPLREGILDACVKQCAALAGLSSAEAQGLHGHSCRSGGVSALHALGGSIFVGAARGGWKSLATIYQHYLVLDVVPSAAAFQLLGFLLAPGVREAVRAQCCG